MLTTYTIDGFENIQYQGLGALRHIEATLTNLYRLHGYHPIAIPTFEVYDQLVTENAIKGDDLFKLISRKGKVLALKPDATLSVARMAAINHHDPNELIKFFYQTNIYRNFGAPGDVKKEFTQMGVEFFGDNNPQCDAEIIALAIESLRANGIEDVQIDLGHVGYINVLLDELLLTPNERESLIHLIDNKNIADIRDFLSHRDFDKKVSDIILELPTLYGKPTDVFERMTALCINDKMKNVVADLRAIYHQLDILGLSDAVTFDLGFTSAMNYYSDMVFKAYVGGFGKPIIDGGRYNSLSRKFGIDRPACGFAVDLLSLMDYLDEQGLLTEGDATRNVILYREAQAADAFKQAKAMRDDGHIVETFKIEDNSDSAYQKAAAEIGKQQLYQNSVFYAVDGGRLITIQK